MSTQRTLSLHAYAPPVPVKGKNPSETQTHLYAVLGQLDSPFSTIDDLLKALDTLQTQGGSFQREDNDSHDDLVSAVLVKVAMGVYGHTVDELLREALEAENEAEWWGRVERSKLSTAYFLLQSKSSVLSEIW